MKELTTSIASEIRTVNQSNGHFFLKALGGIILAWFLLTAGLQFWGILTLKPYPHPEQFDGKGLSVSGEVYACEGKNALRACTKDEAIHQRLVLLPDVFLWSWGMPMFFGTMGASPPFWTPYHRGPIVIFVHPYFFILLAMVGVFSVRRLAPLSKKKTSQSGN